ncbi:MAG TPA: hypothetical protein VNO23_09710 [Candidatus Binatia bacterium]|nr:hypothetical protein [Candidatus Binatia bacterium]
MTRAGALTRLALAAAALATGSLLLAGAAEVSGRAICLLLAVPHATDGAAAVETGRCAPVVTGTRPPEHVRITEC